MAHVRRNLPGVLGDLSGSVRIQHTRRMLEKIVEHKEQEKVKIVHQEKYLKRLSVVLSVLLTIQFALNVGQTSVFADVDKRIVGALSVLASVNSFALACLGKHTLKQSKKLEKYIQTEKSWDKAEDTFTLELANSLEDGQLTSAEYQKLLGIYKDVGDFVDGRMKLDPADQKISPI